MHSIFRSRVVTFLIPFGLAALLGGCGTPDLRSPAGSIEPVAAAQPLVAHARRVVEASELLGVPLRAAERRALSAAYQEADDSKAVAAIQRVLDAHCLVNIHINAESRVKAARGPARAELVQNGWRPFLIKVQNDAGTTAELVAVSPNARALWSDPWAGSRPSLGSASDAFYQKPENSPAKPTPRELWLELDCYTNQPLAAKLSGAKFEYRLFQLYSRDAGQREARLSFDTGQGTQDLGFRSDVDILFRCLPARDITLRVRDEHGKPTTAAFVIRDHLDRTYPSQFKRLAPDFWFHPQIYRADGETLSLPDGEYTIEFSRGPESIPQTRTVSVDSRTRQWEFQIERWIDPSQSGWWSGDHHIHAAGCQHYTKPTEGVHPPDMIRHCIGEDLKIGSALTWGPCFDYQKQFFTGQDHLVSQPPYLLHYDIEVSMFGSHESGHLCLLRLKDQIYPGGDSKDHWPTLGLNILRWAKKQGAVCGPAHSAWGLQVNSTQLPNYIIPPYDSIGANEYIVDVTHEVPGPDGKLVPAVDFMSAVDTPCVPELNMWYHTLNVGFRTRLSGETDFPCMFDDRVGVGRSYVRLDGQLNYHDWCEGIRQGRNYVGDGRSHFLEFSARYLPAPNERAAVNTVNMGERGSELKIPRPGLVQLNAKIGARLQEVPGAVRERFDANFPFGIEYWHIERARIPGTRSVPVEVVVNGYPVATNNLIADGAIRDLSFELPIDRSSWVALRILPSSHTNPIWILIGDQPVRASRRSAQWCLAGVDKCWTEKKKFIAPAEMPDAEAAYEHARQTYRRLLAETDVD
jgi:hypothetical protein